MSGKEVVLIAEDNPDEALLMRRALDKAGFVATVKLLNDGEQVLLYLQGLEPYADREANPLPSLIILDLKMPRKSGFEVLEWMRDNPEYAVVPTLVFSSSMIEADIRDAYLLGANTFITKPSSFLDLVQTMEMIRKYWTKAQKVGPVKKKREHSDPKKEPNRAEKNGFVHTD
jgi:CheY-like chemotaxis protein